jgi:hypothetical protein
MDTARFALFIASMVGIYKGSLCTLRHVRPGAAGKYERQNAFLAGCLSGLALLLDGNRGRRVIVALYLSTRGAQYLCTSLFEQWRMYREQQQRRPVSDSSLARLGNRSSPLIVLVCVIHV